MYMYNVSNKSGGHNHMKCHRPDIYHFGFFGVVGMTCMATFNVYLANFCWIDGPSMLPTIRGPPNWTPLVIRHFAIFRCKLRL
jgi:hypothetical protein